MSISKNAAYNVLGAALPSALTLVTVPLYLDVVGIERYGVLTLFWVILGYSGFLEWGLGSAVARKIAENGNEDNTAVADVFWTSVWLSLLLGIVGAAVIYFGATFYFSNIADVTTEFRSEIARTVPLLAPVVPLVMLGGALGGALQGRERFLALNAAGAMGSTLVSVLPLLLAYLWTPKLQVLIAGALAGRLIALLWLFWSCKKAVPVARPRKLSPRVAKDLLGFGGWVALTNVATGVLATVDRLVIGSKIGAASVPAYAIPFGLVSRMVLIPHSLSAALFPRFAYVDEEERQRLTSSSIQAIAVLVTPMAIAIVAVAEPFFRIWIGPELAATSVPIAYVLVGGFWVYSISHTAFSMLQATGRPKVVSKLLLAEIIPYWAALLIGISEYGLIGAAIAFSLRVTVECVILLTLAKMPIATLKRLILPALLTLASLGAAAGLAGAQKYLLLAALFGGAAVWSVLNIPEVLRPYLRRLTLLLPLSQA